MECQTMNPMRSLTLIKLESISTIRILEPRFGYSAETKNYEGEFESGAETKLLVN